jgi:hypothetical protein
MEKMTTAVLVESLTEREKLGDLGVDGWIIFILIFERRIVKLGWIEVAQGRVHRQVTVQNIEFLEHLSDS